MRHFVEIASKPVLKLAFPRETTYFSIDRDSRIFDPDGRSFSLNLRTLPKLLRELRSTSLTMVLCEPTQFAPWDPYWVGRTIFDRRTLQGHVPLVRYWGPQLLRLARGAPLAVLDLSELPLINRHDVFLLRQAAVYFKRELPVDYWRLFTKTVHRSLPTNRFRMRKNLVQAIKRIKPISVGLPQTYFDDPQRARNSKEYDVFFSGRVEGSSTVVQQGLAELHKLAKSGLRIDYADHRLPATETLDRMSRARLTWSPEGAAWDSSKHYEALVCGSVPVINSPTVERYQPLRDGVHACYYPVEAGNLTQCILKALADPVRIDRMATDGRLHVLRYHTSTAIANYIVQQTLLTSSAGFSKQIRDDSAPIWRFSGARKQLDMVSFAKVPFRIKICGVTQLNDLEYVIHSGCDAVGFNFVSTSPRSVTLEQGSRLSHAAQGKLVRVAVVREPTTHELDQLLDQVPLDAIQFHGRETPAIVEHCRGLRIIKALSWSGQDWEIELAQLWLQRPEHLAAFLIDAAEPVHGRSVGGGTGRLADWHSLFPRPYQLSGKPLILAGGLRPDNVARAIQQTVCDGVDTASGVEISPGIKDKALIAEFVEQARRSFEKLK